VKGTGEAAGKRRVLAIQVVYAVGVLAWYFAVGIPPAPGLLLIVALVFLSANTSDNRDWAWVYPFISLFFCYQALGRLSHSLEPDQINITNLIAWERALFAGTIPAAVFQKAFFDKPYTWLLDILSNALYFSHFIVPALTGFLLFRKRKNAFWVYVFGLLLLSYLGFAIYVLFPAAPPWWAVAEGYLNEQIDLSHFLMSGASMTESTPNPVAAVPSLHCAYPLYIALMAATFWGWRAVWYFVLAAGVTFSVVYLGHHYLIDALPGYLLAVIAFMLARWLYRRGSLLTTFND